MFYIIILIIAAVLWVYIDRVSFKATAKWSGKGVRGTANYIHSAKLKADQLQVDDPTRETSIISDLDSVVNLTEYHKESQKSKLASAKELAALTAKLS